MGATFRTLVHLLSQHIGPLPWPLLSLSMHKLALTPISRLISILTAHSHVIFGSALVHITNRFLARSPHSAVAFGDGASRPDSFPGVETSARYLASKRGRTVIVLLMLLWMCVTQIANESNRFEAQSITCTCFASRELCGIIWILGMRFQTMICGGYAFNFFLFSSQA